MQGMPVKMLKHKNRCLADLVDQLTEVGRLLHSTPRPLAPMAWATMLVVLGNCPAAIHPTIVAPARETPHALMRIGDVSAECSRSCIHFGLCFGFVWYPKIA